MQTTRQRSFFPRKLILRPQSIAGNDVDMSAIEEALKLDNIREVPPSPTEIPQEEPKNLHRLEHINKFRPKPKRNRPLSKLPGTRTPTDPPNNEGLGNFFPTPERAAPVANRVSWNKTADTSQPLPVFMVSPSVSRKDLFKSLPPEEVVRRTFEPVMEESEKFDRSDVGAAKPPFGLSDRGFTADMLAEIRAKQEARASGIFSLNVNNVGSGEPSGRRSKSPPPTTPKPKVRVAGVRKNSGTRTAGEFGHSSALRLAECRRRPSGELAVLLGDVYRVCCMRVLWVVGFYFGHLPHFQTLRDMNFKKKNWKENQLSDDPIMVVRN